MISTTAILIAVTLLADLVFIISMKQGASARGMIMEVLLQHPQNGIDGRHHHCTFRGEDRAGQRRRGCYRDVFSSCFLLRFLLSVLLMACGQCSPRPGLCSPHGGVQRDHGVAVVIAACVLLLAGSSSSSSSSSSAGATRASLSSLLKMLVHDDGEDAG